MERMEVMVPAPAIRGKAIGTMEALLGSSSLYRVIPKIISMAKKNRIKAPATAKEFISIPMRLRISSPTKRNATIRHAATMEAFPDCICPTLFRRLMIMGMLPTISITAKSIIVAEAISLTLKCNDMADKFVPNVR